MHTSEVPQVERDPKPLHPPEKVTAPASLDPENTLADLYVTLEQPDGTIREWKFKVDLKQLEPRFRMPRIAEIWNRLRNWGIRCRACWKGDFRIPDS